MLCMYKYTYIGIQNHFLILITFYNLHCYMLSYLEKEWVELEFV